MWERSSQAIGELSNNARLFCPKKDELPPIPNVADLCRLVRHFPARGHRTGGEILVRKPPHHFSLNGRASTSKLQAARSSTFPQTGPPPEPALWMSTSTSPRSVRMAANPASNEASSATSLRRGRLRRCADGAKHGAYGQARRRAPARQVLRLRCRRRSLGRGGVRRPSGPISAMSTCSSITPVRAGGPSGEMSRR